MPRLHTLSRATLGLWSAGLIALAAPAGAEPLEPLAPADGATLPLDETTAFVAPDTCTPVGPGPTHGFVEISTTDAVDADGNLQKPPAGSGQVFDLHHGMQVVGDGTMQYVLDPWQVPYSQLPAAGSTVYWQARCPPGPSGPSPSIPRRLTVVQGSRAIPPSSSEIGFTINDGALFTNDPGVVLTVAAPEFSTEVRVSNDGGFAGSKTFPVPTTYRLDVPWRLAESGPERLPKTAYLRFAGGNTGGPPVTGVDPTQTFTDDIILDQTSPAITSVEEVSGNRSMVRVAPLRATERTKLRIRARDNLSGVVGLQLTHEKRKPGKVLPFEKRVTVRGVGRVVYLRVQDGADNWSRWKAVRIGEPT